MIFGEACLNSIKFYMMYDNVLEESNSDKIDFRECKLNYLKAENNLLNLQLTTVA